MTAANYDVMSLDELRRYVLTHRDDDNAWVGRRIELTQAGRTLQKEAQKILAQVDLTARIKRSAKR